MSTVKCLSCSSTWDAAWQPLCQTCLEAEWASDPDMIRMKHDPRELPRAENRFRSVLSFEFIQNSAAFFSHAIRHGSWYISNAPQHRGKPCHFTPGPMTDFAGSGVPPGTAMPTYGMDGLLIADPVNDAHVYAEDSSRFQSTLSSGGYLPLPTCAESGCSNLVYPGESLCVVHRTHPLAVPEETA